eukprot:TRINITY_DN3538_c0_g1_i2.p1 TRINITY_DN3538_c0_g1~~TRINITY_DN3538_c0_g1_i2.p1  ORF type:complete len:218 (-),score=13.27 TRINITY_DN3538_c0_g1_i2:234-887(-)
MMSRIVRDNLDAWKLSFEKYLLHAMHHAITSKYHFKLLHQHLFWDIPSGQRMITHHRGFSNFLSTIYPHLPLTILDLHKSANAFWTTGNNDRNFLELISQKIPKPVETQQDWKDFDIATLRNWDGASLICKYPSVLSLFESTFPELSWNSFRRFPVGSSERRVWVDGLVARRYGFVERSWPGQPRWRGASRATRWCSSARATGGPRRATGSKSTSPP